MCGPQAVPDGEVYLGSYPPVGSSAVVGRARMRVAVARWVAVGRSSTRRARSRSTIVASRDDAWEARALTEPVKSAFASVRVRAAVAAGSLDLVCDRPSLVAADDVGVPVIAPAMEARRATASRRASRRVDTEPPGRSGRAPG
jgi:hypothetical protein